MAATYAANGGLQNVQEVSLESICGRTRYLTNDVIARAREQGWMVHAPVEPELRSSLAMIEAEQAEELVSSLAARDIIIDARPGLLRVSPYFYNSSEENAIGIDAISGLLEK